jgi:apolipoprotein N-acyltransferase
MTTIRKVQLHRAVMPKTIALRIGLGIALSVLSGVMLMLAFPPRGVWPLMWVGFVPWLIAQHRLMPLRYSRWAPAIAIGVWWWPLLARIFAGGPWFLVHLGLFIAGIFLLISTERTFHERTHYRWFVLQGAVYWVGIEMIRSFIPFLGTMGFVANTQAGQAWLIQPVSIFGIYGLGLMIMLTNFALAQAGLAWFDQKWPLDDAVPVDPRSARRWLAGVGIGLAAWIGLSLIILGSAPQDAPTLRVAALQPGFPEPAHVDQSTPQELRVQTLLAEGREAAGQGAKVLFTPELGMAIDPQVEYTQEFKALTTETGTYAFLTYGLNVAAGFRNESVLLTPAGQFLQVYGKIHPSPGERKAIYSDVYPVYETPLGRLATVICMDSNFTDVTRRLARQGAQLIAVPMRETQGISEQTWTHHVFRAIETRTAIVKTDVAWGSTLIDPYGRILAMKLVPEATRLTLVGDVPLGDGAAPLVWLGDWVGWIMLAGFVFFVAFQTISNSRAKKAQKG